MKRDMTEQEFNEWKQQWFREKGCPFFTCLQILNRKVCGNSFICGIFTYDMYLNKKWIKECNIKLAEDIKQEFPTRSCVNCTSSTCIKMNHQNGQTWAQSPCKFMNDYFTRRGMIVNRSLEKYILTYAVYLFPIIDEDTFLKLQANPELLEEIIKKH